MEMSAALCGAHDDAGKNPTIGRNGRQYIKGRELVLLEPCLGASCVQLLVRVPD
jgi:hypothetical protein